jgi:Tfp pilus assembly protein PilV
VPNRSRGFTLVEALVGVLLIGVGVVAAMNGLSAIARTDFRVRESEQMQQLAIEKYEELVATGEALNAGQSGDFADRNLDDYRWTVESEGSGIENLQSVTVTVRRGNGDAREATISGLVYQAPATEAAP